MKNLIHITLLLALSFSAFSKEYHVDCSNSRKGNGSIENPFQTISQANKTLKAGDVCYIHAGTYHEMINPKNSGVAEQPILYKPFEDDIVIISATDEVKGWEKHDGNIYKTKVKMPLGVYNNVYCNAEKMQIARWPNNVDNNEYSLDAKYINIDQETWSMSFISNDEIPAFDWAGGTIHYLGAHSGCSWERTITGYDKDLHQVHFETLPAQWPFGTTHSPKRLENGHRGIFFLMDKLEALDAPREWYYDQEKKELYFYAPEGKNPTEANVEVTARIKTVNIEVDYVTLAGLNFFGGMVSRQGNNTTVKICRVKRGGERLVTNLNGAAVSDAAVQVLSGSHNVIEKCVLENGSVSGLNIASSATDCRVENNIVQHFNTIGIHAYILNSQGARSKILYNSLYGSARDGSRVTGDDSEFGYNHVQKSMISGADGGLFYVTGRSIPKNIELHHNWFHDAYADTHAGKKATGIYLDNNAAGYIVHHNVVWDVEWAGLHFNWNAIQNEIYNNTFWNVGPEGQAMIDCWVPAKNGQQYNVEDNTLYNNISDVRPWWHSGNGPRYRVDEKEYIGPKADNDFDNNWQFTNVPFHFTADKRFVPLDDSPLVDGAKVVKGINENYKGEAPDLGAYELGGEYWVPGVNWTPKGFAWEVSKDYLNIGDMFKKIEITNKKMN